MNILVIGGMHGNEPLGIEVVKLFNEKPVSGVDTILANEQAVAASSRFKSQDLNRSFPGESSSDSYELRRAAELLQLCSQYDVVLDFHNTHCPDNDCSFVGDTANSKLFNVSAFLGLNRVIVADYDCINKFAPNCISIEISLDSPVMDATQWYQKICGLSQKSILPTAEGIEKYRFVYRMTVEDKERLELDQQNLRAFKPLDGALAEELGVSYPAYPIFIADKYTPYNYGGILNKLTKQ